MICEHAGSLLGAAGPYARGEMNASGSSAGGGEPLRSEGLQKPLIVIRFDVAVGATGQTKWKFEGITLKITSTLNPGLMYCPVGHQNSDPPHSRRQSLDRYQMYATERGSLARESLCGKAYSVGRYQVAATLALPEQSVPESSPMNRRVAAL
jgi:hypothetical protein